MGCGSDKSDSNKVQETAYEIELSKITNEQWNRFKKVHQPLFNDLAGDITGIGQAEKNTVAGLVSSGLTKQYGDRQEAAAKNLSLRGVGPSSLAIGDISRERAGVVTGGMVKGQGEVDNTKVAGLQNLVNMARGDAGEAMRGISDIAGEQVQDATSKAIYDQQDRNETLETAGTAAGMGLAAGADWYKKKEGY